MGMRAYAKCLDENAEYRASYMQYSRFLIQLAYAYNKEIGDMFKRLVITDDCLTQAEADRWNQLCNDDLDLWLFHPDNKGKFTPEECGKIYNAIKDMKMDFMGHNSGDEVEYNMLDHWKHMFYLCWKERNCLFFD